MVITDKSQRGIKAFPKETLALFSCLFVLCILAHIRHADGNGKGQGGTGGNHRTVNSDRL